LSARNVVRDDSEGTMARRGTRLPAACQIIRNIAATTPAMKRKPAGIANNSIPELDPAI